MSKQCQVCQTINHSAANHCSNCGNELPDKELAEEDKLRIELHQANATIQGLNIAHSKIQKDSILIERKEKTIIGYKNKLEIKESEIARLENIINETNNKYKRKRKISKISLSIWIIISLVACLMLGLYIFDLNQKIDNINNKNNSTLNSLTKQLETKENKINQLKEVINNKVEKINELKNSLINLQQKIDELGKKNSESESSIQLIQAEAYYNIGIALEEAASSIPEMRALFKHGKKEKVNKTKEELRQQAMENYIIAANLGNQEAKNKLNCK
jgi:uncharacterized protein YoxC